MSGSISLHLQGKSLGNLGGCQCSKLSINASFLLTHYSLLITHYSLLITS
ncbi:MAG: hypothetical protein F6K47_36185 [Symploca sp. SIO2E6]|nr:hypothetical protein [Symploca sp. SIO2E6]